MVMKIEEFKTIVEQWSDQIINVWFGSSNMGDMLIKPAMKVVIKNQVEKMDGLLHMFADSEGVINIEHLLTEYHNNIPVDGIQLDPKHIIGDNFISKNISIKVLEKKDIETLKKMIMGRHIKLDK